MLSEHLKERGETCCVSKCRIKAPFVENGPGFLQFLHSHAKEREDLGKVLALKQFTGHNQLN
jgi:hypothetical protein